MALDAVTGSGRTRWSITPDALASLRADAERLADDAIQRDGYVTAYLTGEADAPTLVPNVYGQGLLRQLQGVRSALARAWVESDGQLAVIGRRVTLQSGDGARRCYTIVIPGRGDPANGCVAADSPVGHAVYRRRIGEEVQVEAPNGSWTATIVAVE